MSIEHKYSYEGKTSEKELLKYIHDNDSEHKKYKKSYRNVSYRERQKRELYLYYNVL